MNTPSVSGSGSISGSSKVQMHGDACHDAWNGSGTDFGASQCFPMDLDADADIAAAAAAAARCVHSLSHCTLKPFNHYTNS